jgi:poly(3-hydroxybutyrate) depolymerase
MLMLMSDRTKRLEVTRMFAGLAASLALLAAGDALAQLANMPTGGPKPPKWSALPDWNGVWERDGDIVWDDRIPVGVPQRAPYNEQYQKLAASAPTARGGQRGAAGMPGMMTLVFPVEVEINPREVLLIPESGPVRRIYTDGRQHPSEPLPNSAGHSIGRWHGQELLVDTCCVKDSIRLPGGGPHSSAMTIKERIYASDASTLVDEITVEDPQALTKPWSTVKTFRRRPQWEPVEYDTEENNRDFIINSGSDAPGAAAPGPVTTASAGAPDRRPPASHSGKPADVQTLQQATTLAIGNLAWESVKVSDVQRDATTVKWVATTRSQKLNCTAAPDGSNPYCQRSATTPAAAGYAATPDAASPATLRAAAGDPAIGHHTISVDGEDRTYSYFVSSKANRATFTFVVLALPDNSQSTEQFAQTSGWLSLAEDNGFAVVFPEAAKQTWANYSGGEDHYLKAVFDHARTHLIPLGAGGPAAEGRRGEGEGRMGAGGGGAGGERGGGPNREGGGREVAGREGAAMGGGNRDGGANREGGGMRGNRIPTWAPFYYLTGVGAGGTVAQEFAVNHPGLFAAVATLDAAPFEAVYARGDEPAQHYFQNIRPGKNVPPVWKQLKREVPVAVWIFNSATASAPAKRLVDYWRRSNAVAGTAATRTVGGFKTQIYNNSNNDAQQVRLTTLDAATKYDAAMSSAIWNDLFAHVARWTSSPNGDVGSMLTEAEANAAFQVKTVDVGSGEPYKYYVKLPSAQGRGQALPVVISAHGANFPAWLYLSQIKMHAVGEREGFITVYPSAHNNMWDFTHPDGPDQKFIEQLIRDVVQTYGADSSRVYMQGFSFGSGLTFMMGVSHPQLFAAISPNNGFGAFTPEVQAAVAAAKAKSDIRIPTMMVYGDVDSGSSVDGAIPAQGVLRDAIDQLKTFNHITAADRIEKVSSSNSAPYDALVPGGKLVRAAADRRYPQGRFEIYRYTSADPAPLGLFDVVWIKDLSHGADLREAQLEWDFFKHWRRNTDGTLSFTAR